jgi:hypothetical protein
MNRGDLVRIRQTWGLFQGRLGVVIDWWDDTPITVRSSGHYNDPSKRIGCEVMLLENPATVEEFYDYQLEVISEGRYEKRDN